ncbi:hypothetical protein M5W68_21500 [Paenibacillus larvae]|nr:hypothetical protein [Paenibacillus larvae]MCY9508459.1 hypothetical protein [Paenibacillus larvae]MCY9527597.1 hypothetical protein [Paenibacillus larvae]
MGSNSVWLSNKNNAGHKIYGLSKDNSIGIGTLGIGVGAVGTPLPLFIEFIGNTNGKAWMTADTRPLNSLNFPPLVNRQTPFQVIEAH